MFDKADFLDEGEFDCEVCLLIHWLIISVG